MSLKEQQAAFYKRSLDAQSVVAKRIIQPTQEKKTEEQEEANTESFGMLAAFLPAATAKNTYGKTAASTLAFRGICFLWSFQL